MPPSTLIDRPLSATWLTLAMLAFCCILLDAGLSQAALINNGDYWRVTGQWVNVPDWQAWQACQQVSWSDQVPRSPTAMVFALNALGHWALGSCMPPEAHGALLSAVLLAGVLALHACHCLNLVSCITLLASSLALAPLLFSLYQESLLLPLLPWCLLGLQQLWAHGRMPLFLLAAALVLGIKAQMALLLPVALAVLWWARQQGRCSPRSALVAAALLCLVTAYTLAAQRHHANANGYNRWFNGVGWAAQGVGQWPARSFSERQAHFQAQQAALQTRSAALESNPSRPLMGTSFWPEGIALQDTPAWQDVSPRLPALAWVQALVVRPQLAWQWGLSAWQLTAQSSYQLSYLSSPAAADGLLHAPRRALLGHLGWLWLGTVVGFGLAAARRRSLALAAVATCLLGMPWLVVAGDGFYEYEKHFLSYLACVPLFVMGTQLVHGVRSPR